MQFQFSNDVAKLQPSAIREILKFTSMPGVISFAAGNPAPEAFPTELIADLSSKLLREHPVLAMQYSITEGYPELREQLKQWMTEKHCFSPETDDLIITSGAQQANELSCKVLLNPGDTLICEAPSFIGSLNAFRSYGVNLVSVPLEEDGMDLAALEHTLQTEPNCKLIYIIPNFQNPTGRTWDLDRRHQFMDIVNKYEIPVIEDNPYGELRFEGEYMPALKSLDTKGLVIYLGTFSKILAPGYRIGWVCAEEHILAKYNFMEQAASLQASTIGQMETSKWIDMFDLDAHVATIRACYDKRRKVMLETLERELPEGCTFTHPVGGLFAWVVLPEYMDAKELQMKCLEKKVAFVPGGSFFPNGNHENTLRLNYSCMPEEKIVQGITALCQTIRENLR